MGTGTKTQPNKLNTLAGELHARLETKGDVAALHRPLPHGLQLVMQRQDRHRWRLALGREGVYPSDMEVEICRQAFAVPDTAEITKRTAAFRHPKRYSFAHLFQGDLEKLRKVLHHESLATTGIYVRSLQDPADDYSERTWQQLGL